jgi:hypothetical protein
MLFTGASLRRTEKICTFPYKNLTEYYYFLVGKKAKDLKRKPCERYCMITVKPGENRPIEFRVDEEAKALGISEGVAVATRDFYTGTLSYLLLNTDVQKFLEWLTGQISTQAKVYLVGGWPNASEQLLDALRKGLEDSGMKITGEDTMSQQNLSRDLTMERSGAVTVEHYRMSRTPVGDMKRDTVWINYLSEPTESRK